MKVIWFLLFLLRRWGEVFLMGVRVRRVVRLCALVALWMRGR